MYNDKPESSFTQQVEDCWVLSLKFIPDHWIPLPYFKILKKKKNFLRGTLSAWLFYKKYTFSQKDSLWGKLLNIGLWNNDNGYTKATHGQKDIDTKKLIRN